MSAVGSGDVGRVLHKRMHVWSDGAAEVHVRSRATAGRMGAEEGQLLTRNGQLVKHTLCGGEAGRRCRYTACVVGMGERVCVCVCECVSVCECVCGCGEGDKGRAGECCNC